MGDGGPAAGARAAAAAGKGGAEPARAGRSLGTREHFSPPGASGVPVLRATELRFGLCGPRGGSGPAERRRGSLAFRVAPRSAAYVTPGASGRSCPAGSSSAPARGSELRSLL